MLLPDQCLLEDLYHNSLLLLLYPKGSAVGCLRPKRLSWYLFVTQVSVPVFKSHAISQTWLQPVPQNDTKLTACWLSRAPLQASSISRRGSACSCSSQASYTHLQTPRCQMRTTTVKPKVTSRETGPAVSKAQHCHCP